MSAELRVKVLPWRDWSSVVDAWRDLVERCPGASFFVTPDWVAAWLEVFAPSLEPRLVHFYDGESTLVGVCVLVERTVRKGPFEIRRVYLNTAGEDSDDSPCVERNMFLCEPGFENAMAASLRRCLANRRVVRPWDELCVPGLVDSESLLALADAFDDHLVEDESRANRFVPLDQLRASGMDYIESLSSADRMHVRQNLGSYAALGPLEIVEAATADEALRFLDGLADLHQRRRSPRGVVSPFASESFYEFHRTLVRRCFSRGNIHLIRLRAGRDLVGYHYNLRYRGRTSFYQCGYDDDLRERNSPGLAMHVLAVQRALDAGLREYDFMAGDVAYRRRLAPLSREMHWIAWRQPNLKMKTVDVLRQARRRVPRWARSAYRTLRRSKPA